jgi:hypothetical protein
MAVTIAIAATVGTLALLGLVVMAPLRLSWQHWVRWLIASNTDRVSEFGSLGADLDLREVTALAVVPGPVSVVRIADGAGRTQALSLTEVCAEDQARLRRWAAANTPLLWAALRDGEVVLSGPTCSVSGLRSTAALAPVGRHGRPA